MPGWLEIKWYSSSLINVDNVNILGGRVRSKEKTRKLC